MGGGRRGCLIGGRGGDFRDLGELTCQFPPDLDFATDKELFASLPGGQAVIDWFGSCPGFHDAVLEKLELSGGDASLFVQAHWMTKDIDERGFYVLDRKALICLHLRKVTGVRLEGDASSIISGLYIRRLSADAAATDWPSCGGPRAGDIEVTFDTAVGLYGSLYAKELTFALEPSPILTSPYA